MSPRTGRPKSEDPKDKLVRVRMTESDLALLDECASEKQCSRSEVVRDGIQLVKRSIEEQK